MKGVRIKHNYSLHFLQQNPTKLLFFFFFFFFLFLLFLVGVGGNTVTFTLIFLGPFLSPRSTTFRQNHIGVAGKMQMRSKPWRKAVFSRHPLQTGRTEGKLESEGFNASIISLP